MNSFDIIKRRKSNPIDLSSVDKALDQINTEHVNNIVAYNELKTKINTLDVNEHDKPLLQQKINDITSRIDSLVGEDELYHGIGDELLQLSFDVANDKDLEKAVTNNVKFNEYKKTIESSKIPEPMKNWLLEKNSYINGLNEKGEWNPVYKATEYIDIEDIEKSVEGRLIKTMGSYGQLYYKTNNNLYTTDRGSGIDSQPYYLENGKYVPLNLKEVRSNVLSEVYNNIEYISSLKQEYDYYNDLFLKSGDRNNNPIFNTGIEQPLTFDEFVEKRINGFYNNKSLDEYYDGIYVNPVVKNSNTYRDSRGRLIEEPSKEEIRLAREKYEQGILDEEEFEDRRSSIMYFEGRPYKPNNTKNIFNGFHASKGYLQHELDELNMSLPKESQLILDNGTTPGDIKRKLIKHYGSELNIPFNIRNALSSYEDNIILMEELLNQTIPEKEKRQYIALKYYIDKGINILPYDDEFDALLIQYEKTKNASNTDEEVIIYGDNFVPNKIKVQDILHGTVYDFKDKNGNLISLSDDVEDLYGLLTDNKIQSAKLISDQTMSLISAGYYDTEIDTKITDKKSKYFLDQQDYALSNLSSYSNVYEVFAGVDQNQPLTKRDGTEAYNIGKLINYYRSNLPDNINVYYDPVNLDCVIELTKPVYDISTKEKETKLNGEKITINTLLEGAGFKNVSDNTTVTIRIPNLYESEQKNDYLNQPEIKYTQRVNQLLQSNLKEHKLGYDNLSIKWTGDNDIYMYDLGTKSGVNITKNDLMSIYRAKDYLSLLTEYYSKTDQNYKLKENDIDNILKLADLYPNINNDNNLTAEQKDSLIINNLYSILLNINKNIANQFKTLIDVN